MASASWPAYRFPWMTPLTVIPVPGHGAEDVVVDADGSVYTGTEDGAIWRVQPDGRRLDLVGNTAGRPLGIELLPDGRLLVCDARRGLLALDPRSGRLEVLTGLVHGQPMEFCNNAAVRGDGTIWFTDSSRHHGIERWRADMIEDTSSGRLLRRDPDGHLEVLVEGLRFANGVALSADESYIAVAQTAGRSVVRHWLTGERAGRTEPFVSDLPGYPDNIARGSDGLDLGRDRLDDRPGGGAADARADAGAPDGVANADGAAAEAEAYGASDGLRRRRRPGPRHRRRRLAVPHGDRRARARRTCLDRQSRGAGRRGGRHVRSLLENSAGITSSSARIHNPAGYHFDIARKGYGSFTRTGDNWDLGPTVVLREPTRKDDMGNALDVDLQDDETVEEIRLVTELMVVAASAPGELEQDVIDGALGVDDSHRPFPNQRRAE